MSVRVVAAAVRAKGEFRDRPADEVAVLDALVDRGADGMTVLELRSAVDADIDAIEAALEALKEDGLLVVEDGEEPLRIRPADRVVPDDEPDDPSMLDAVRDRLGL